MKQVLSTIFAPVLFVARNFRSILSIVLILPASYVMLRICEAGDTSGILAFVTLCFFMLVAMGLVKLFERALFKRERVAWAIYKFIDNAVKEMK